MSYVKPIPYQKVYETLKISEFYINWLTDAFSQQQCKGLEGWFLHCSTPKTCLFTNLSSYIACIMVLPLSSFVSCFFSHYCIGVDSQWACHGFSVKIVPTFIFWQMLFSTFIMLYNELNKGHQVIILGACTRCWPGFLEGGLTQGSNLWDGDVFLACKACWNWGHVPPSPPPSEKILKIDAKILQFWDISNILHCSKD